MILRAALTAMTALVMPSLALSQTTGTGSYVPPGNYGATAVLPNPTLLGFYAADSAGSFEGVNAWLGRPMDFASIHSGQASESDFLNSVGYVLWSNQYTMVNAAGVAGSRLLSVPLIWQGASLSAAAAGTYNSDYATVAQTILANIPAGPAPGQSVIYIRTGWEQNLAGEMPWSATGQEAQFIGAFQQFVTVFRANDPTGRFRFVWCPNVGGDPIMNSYPGDAYVDVTGMDFYYGLNTLTNDPDPDTAFQEMLDNGLSEIANLAATHGKQLAFPEWGVNQDNFGNYVKDFFDWCRAQSCLYATYWDNNGGYPGEISDGTYPETGAMFRHLWDPANYPVEPIAAPVGVAALGGNASVQITANPVRSSTPVTTYYLYKGASSGNESTVPVASSSTPSFTDTQANGQPAYYRMGAGNALSQGYLSAEVSATPRAPSTRPVPADYLAVPVTGYAVSTTPALTRLSQATPSLTTATIVALIAAKPGPSLIAGFPHALTLGLDANNHLTGFSADYWNNQWTATSTLAVPFPADGVTPEWVRVDFNTWTMTTTFYVAPVNGPNKPNLDSKNWNQLGAPQTGQNHNSIWDQSVEPFYVASPNNGTNQLVGNVYDMAFYANGVAAAHPHFDTRSGGTRNFPDTHADVWAVGGGAYIK